VEYWIKEVLDKVVSNRFLLMVDQLSPQADITAYENNLTKGQSCKLLVIPRKATSTKQPCDTYFFRQWKMLTKRIYHRVSLDELDVDLRSHHAIIKLQNLVHNELSSSLFKPTISYAWSTCGYIPKQYSNFSSVIEVYFSFDADSCSNNNCEQSAFIFCSHCGRILCFEHFSPRIIVIDCVLDMFSELNELNDKMIVYATRNTKIIKLKLRNVEKSFLMRLRLVESYHVNNTAMHKNNLENIKSTVSLNSFGCDM